MKKLFISILILLGSSFLLIGQDARYSQFFNAPVRLNPALTGVENGKLRFGGNYRSQWNSTNSPIDSYQFYFDKSNPRFSYGLVFNQKNAGKEGFKTSSALLSLSLKKQLQEGNNWLSFGIQAGVFQQRFDLSNITFDNQYNPEKGYDSSLEHGEDFQKTSILLPDLNVGVNWRFSKNTILPIIGDVGIAFSHINSPKSSFFNENIHLPLKTAFYGNALFDLNNLFGFEPFFLFSLQGSSNEFVYGIKSIFHFENNNLKLGLGNRAKDALIIYSSFSFKNFELGFSYDVNLQNIRNQGNANSIEFSLIYQFGKETDSKSRKKKEKPKVEHNEDISSDESEESMISSENDSDGDGILDDLDLCPFESGIKKHQGCIDRDDDGIWDYLDACPSLPGILENYGCPYDNEKTDSDGDGVLDQYDDCIYLKGLPYLNGCPDADGDGLSDLNDKCPYEKGRSENNGCPDLESGNDKRSLSSDFVEFETNSSEIKTKYFPFLDRLAFKIKNNNLLKIVIEGHADSEGKHVYNYHLSRQRAQTIRSYFFEKGVPLEQIEMYYYGETKPKIDKDTDYAMARNRRVELIALKSQVSK